MRTEEAEPLRSGLEGVVVAETRLSDVDGQNGRLTIAGFDVGEIAPKASFEEMAALLWGSGEVRLEGHRALSGVGLELVRAAVAAGAPAIDAVRAVVGALPSTGDDLRDAAVVVGAIPTVVAAHSRLAEGREPVAPRPELGHVENFLWMLRGAMPTAAEVRALETYLITVSDHGFNASTFVARAIASTGSDLVSCVAGAVGALKGPLHGGAPGPALDMVMEIGQVERAEAALRARLERGERLMGFGHRIYKVRDPRADVLAAASERLYASGVDRSLYELAMGVEAVALRLLDEYKPGRNLRTNVEFYTALLLQGLGLPTSLFTPTFAIGRSLGWSAHVMEQRRGNRVIRPQSRYVGEFGRRWPV